jgi:hypothetical protein
LKIGSGGIDTHLAFGGFTISEADGAISRRSLIENQQTQNPDAKPGGGSALGAEGR